MISSRVSKHDLQDMTFRDCEFCCGCGACLLAVTLSSASDLGLSSCLWLLSGLWARFPSLWLLVFASRAPVDCDSMISSRKAS
jgi:hypothetical protein